MIQNEVHQNSKQIIPVFSLYNFAPSPRSSACPLQTLKTAARPLPRAGLPSQPPAWEQLKSNIRGSDLLDLPNLQGPWLIADQQLLAPPLAGNP